MYWLFPRMLCSGHWSYRFSAFWLRSKCSICSYQLNIWYVLHWSTTILNWFLDLGDDIGACSDFSTGWPGIAVPPGSAHSPWGVKIQWILTKHRDIYKSLTDPVRKYLYQLVDKSWSHLEHFYIPKLPKRYRFTGIISNFQ